jgi:hypothetical protein
MGTRLDRRRGVASATVLAVLTSLVIAACGGSSTPTTPLTPNNAVGRAEAFEQCLKNHGFTQSLANVTTTNGINPSYLSTLESAYGACHSVLGLKGLSGSGVPPSVANLLNGG